MTTTRNHIKDLVTFEDNKKGIVRSRREMELAIDSKILSINSVRSTMNGNCDYDDSRTEY